MSDRPGTRETEAPSRSGPTHSRPARGRGRNDGGASPDGRGTGRRAGRHLRVSSRVPSVLKGNSSRVAPQQGVLPFCRSRPTRLAPLFKKAWRLYRILRRDTKCLTGKIVVSLIVASSFGVPFNENQARS